MISRRRWALIGSIGSLHSVQLELALEQVEVQDDAGLLAVEPEHVVAVEVQQPLELGDQAVESRNAGTPARRASAAGVIAPPWRSRAARTVTTTASSGANLRTICRCAW